MRDSQLLKIMAALTPEEFDELGHFIRSPYFNAGKRRAQTAALFEFLRPLHPDFPAEKVDKDAVTAQIFPEKKVSELPKIMSDLNQVAERYIAVKMTERPENDIPARLAVAAFFREKRLDTRAARVLRDVEETIEKWESAGQNQRGLYLRYLLEQEKTRSASRENDKSGDLNLRRTLESLDQFYLVARLEHSNGLFAQSLLTPLDTEPFFQVLRQLLAIENLPRIPLASLFEASFRLQTERDTDDDAAFFQLRTLLDQHWHCIEPELRHGFAAHLRNHCSIRYNRGESRFLPVLFELFKEQLGKDVLYLNGKLLPSSLQNIVQVGLRLKQFAWVADFLDAHRERITGTEAPQEVWQFNRAQYLFASEKFEAALDELPQQIRDAHFQLVAKRLEIKVLYELDSVLLLPRMDAFKMFVHRDFHRGNLTADNQVLNNNFLKIMDKLARRPEWQGNRARTEKLVEKIRSQQAVAEREWLLEKLVPVSAGL